MRSHSRTLFERFSEIGIAHVEGLGNLFRGKLVIDVFSHSDAGFLDFLHGCVSIVLVFVDGIDDSDDVHEGAGQERLKTGSLCSSTIKHFGEMLDDLFVYSNMENGIRKINNIWY